MPHLALPLPLPDDAAYVAALRARDALLQADADAASGVPFDDLARLIEDYEARRAGYDLPRMRAALAAWERS